MAARRFAGRQNHQQGGRRYDYVPSQNSGAYAILVSMHQASINEFINVLTKQQILDYCKKYAPIISKDNSKTWSQMQSLVMRGMVTRNIDRETIYQLTEDGKDLAQKLLAMAQAQTEQDETSSDSALQAPGSQHFKTANNHPGVISLDGGNFILKAGTFDIVLIYDAREHTNVNSFDNSVMIEQRTLAAGDYLWVARPKGLARNDKTRDLVLDYVIERKRLDDLTASIISKRLDEQRMRLVGTGVRRPQFMIEQCGLPARAKIPQAALAQKAVNFLIVDKIEVRLVKSAQAANEYLMGMTRSLSKLFSDKDLKSCSQDRMVRGEADTCEFMAFSEFQSKGKKITNWTVGDMLAKHLIQIHGLSDTMVSVIVKQYPSIPDLMDAYERCGGEKEREELLAKLKIPNSNRTIGPVVSKRVCATYAMPADWLKDNNT